MLNPKTCTLPFKYPQCLPKLNKLSKKLPVPHTPMARLCANPQIHVARHNAGALCLVWCPAAVEGVGKSNALYHHKHLKLDICCS